MKRYISIIMAMLTMFSVLPASAQQTQDALYIFRNDGGFNAFFFADIDHIEYSKIDTLGVEQADYVVQEVYALDSIFRIPLNAIDSVSFVTPETKYRADAFVAKANLVDYVIASDSSTWFRVKTETPANLLPKVGDKLLIEESCDLLPGGFSGKVTAVDQAADGITVRTERISLTEVYEQYVWKFDGSELDSEPDAARRRVGGDFNIKGSEKGKVSLSGARTLNKTDVGPWESKLTGNADVNFDYDVGWDLDVRAFLHVSVFTGVQFDATLKGNLTGDFNLEMQGALTQTFEQKLKGTKKGGANLSVGLFLSLSAAIGITSEWKTEGDVFGMAYIHDYIGNSKDTKDVSITGKVTKSELNIGKGNVGKLSASTGLYAKAEFNVKSNNLSVRLELGGNVGIDHNVNLGDVANLNAITIPPAVVFYPADLYQALDRDATLSSYGYFNASASYEVGKYEGTYKPDNEIKFLEKSKTGGWVPHVEGTTFTRDKALQYEGKVSTQLSRKHLLDGIVQPIEVGYLTLDEKQNVIDDYWTSYFDGRTSMNRLLDMLDPDAFYSVIPQVKLWGISMLTGDSVKVTLGPTKFNIERQVDAGREHDYKHLAIDSNIKNLTFTSKADWLKCEDSMTFNYEDDSVTGRELSLEWEDMPEDIYDRRARIDVAGYNQKGDVILEDSVVVVQHEDLLEFTPKSIEAEANGGTYTVNITKTNLTDLSVSTESDFCSATLSDNVITVTVKPSTSAEERYAAVVIKGKNAANKEVSDNIRISQAAGSSPGDDTRSITQKAFCGKWRKLDDINYAITTLIINEDLSYEQKQVCIEDYSENWWSYKKGDVINNRRMFGKFEFWDPDNWTVLPKEYMQQTDLKEYDKGYFVGYKQIERKVADRKYGKWLSDDNSVTMMGYFEISSDYKYMIENNRYLWVKMDENDPYYPEPYMDYKDPAYLDLTDSVSYVSNIRPEPERMWHVNFGINEDKKFLTDIQATPVESFLHVDSIKNRTVYYSFDENTSLKKREGHINVQGTWPDGSIGKAVFTVRQNGGRTLENLSKIYFSGSSKAIKTIVKKHNKDGDTTDTDENSRFGVSLTATSFTVNAAGSGLKIEASDEQNAKNVTFTLSEGFKKRSKANDIVYIQDYTKKIADGTDVLKGSMKASNVPCYNDSGDKMTIRGELSDGVTISDASYMKYWEAENPEKVSGLWYSSESYEYVNGSGNRVEIEITWNIDKWQR